MGHFKSAIWLGSALIVGCGGTEVSVPDGPQPIVAEQYDCRAQATPARRESAKPDCITDYTCDADLVVGHRGVGGNFALFAPENSRSAIRLAIILGVDAVEIDVRHTNDDRLVVMHDDTLKRTTGVDVKVSELSLAEVTAIPLAAATYPGDFACEGVPTFEEIMEIAKGRVFIIVDTKTNRGDLVAAAIRDAGMIDGAVVSVSSPDTAVAARAEVPEIRVQLRPDTIEEYRVMLERFDPAPKIIEIPESQIDAFRPFAESANAKLFVDIFGRDVEAFGAGKLEQYNIPHAAGADVVQTEFPMWVLRAMGRQIWSELPPHRDLGLNSPLLK